MEICQLPKCLLFIFLHKMFNCAADCGEDCRLQSYCYMKNLRIYTRIALQGNYLTIALIWHELYFKKGGFKCNSLIKLTKYFLSCIRGQIFSPTSSFLVFYRAEFRTAEK